MRDGERIVKLERDELRDVGRVEVRQKSALMPAVKALLQFGNGRFPIPLAFCADEFEQAKVFRRRTANWFWQFHAEGTRHLCRFNVR